MNEVLRARIRTQLKSRLTRLERKILYLEKLLNVPIKGSIVLTLLQDVEDRRDPELALTKKQRIFVDSLVKNWNIVQASKRAGYAPEYGYALVNQKKVARALQRESDKQIRKYKIRSKDVLREIAILAYGNIGNYVSWENNQIELANSKYFSPDDFACIREISEQPGKYGRIIKIKMHDKLNALTTLARYKGLLQAKGVGAGTFDGVKSPEEAGRKVKDAVDRLFDSVPSPEDKDIPPNVIKLSKKLEAIEKRKMKNTG